MKKKYAVAIAKGEKETIMAIFNTKAEADIYGRSNVIPHSKGLQYCFKSIFENGKPVGNMRIYDYYNIWPKLTVLRNINWYVPFESY